MKRINLMKNVGRFTPSEIAKYDLPQIICTIYPPEIAKYDLPQIICTIYPPPKIAKCVSVVYELVTLA